MYLVSQNGNQIVQLRDAWVSKTNDGIFVMHNSGTSGFNLASMGSYPTEDAARAQLRRIAAVIAQGGQVYQLDK
jgi:hypothetical protein